MVHSFCMSSFLNQVAAVLLASKNVVLIGCFKGVRRLVAFLR